MSSKGKDLSGEQFGRLRVLRLVSRNPYGYLTWECQCNCGSVVVVSSRNLRSGETQSCGCLRRDLMRARRLTHGKSDTQAHNAYLAMKQRCENLKSPEFHRYGGRGICVEFQSFEEFYKEVGDPPAPHMSIDRIQNNGNYAPGNVRWATKEQQANNTCTNSFIEYKGETKTIYQWARILNIRPGTLWQRLLRYHWSVEKSFTLKVKQGHSKTSTN